MGDTDLREIINRYLIKETDFLKIKDTMTEDQLRNFINQSISDLCYQQHINLNFNERAEIIRTLVSAAVSMGPLRPLMEDPAISEIMINGAKNIYIQKEGRITKADIHFESNQELAHTVQKILAGSGSNKRVDESSPYVDFSLSDGSRVNVIVPPCSLIGPVITIRKFSEAIGTVDDLLERKMFDKRIATLLIAAMKAKLNVIFCGSTGSGKTTMLNVFSRHIPSHERIITIEDTPELRLVQDHVVSLTSKPANIEGKGEISMRELFVNSLRMRPDRIIIGEIRGDELLDFIESISSGHSGSLAIVHAETTEDCFNRLITLMLMTGMRLSTLEIQKMIAKAIDLIVHVELFVDGRRRVTAASDVYFDKTRNEVVINDVFKFQQAGMSDAGEILGEWVMDKREPTFMSKFRKHMVKLPEGFFNKQTEERVA
ncbi:MAG TPA: ATPase, T2SS/T4P/T4SS family [Candidatus Omnitrophota bacterium]|nr:ATPase, T2SS/T4P/T4SS family [Candidatus Omnitrophota bacterium]